NNAVAGAKADMAKYGSNITNNQITTIVNNQLEKNNLTNVITNSQKQQIINLLITIKKSGALNSNSFKEQAQKLSSQIQEGAKSIFNKLNSQDTKNWIQKIIDA
ncbi:DUF1002 domain-containing protein, partial [Enterococcus faecalis]|nr:DUF1002 domain-containing protein [Enterococcus faecalis]